MKHTLISVAVSVLLMACGGGASSAGAQQPPSGQNPDVPIQPVQPSDPDRDALPDNSAKVEIVGAEDPKRYFIANLRALNAVDKDKNGIWDDVELALNERLANAPEAVKNMDRKPLLQVVRHFQDKLQRTTREQAQSPEPTLYSYALACMTYRVNSGQLPESVQVAGSSLNKELVYYAARLAREAVLTSKERVLAAEYADMLASGVVRKGASDDSASCDK